MQETDTIKLSAKVILNLVKDEYRFITKMTVKEWLRDNGYKSGGATNFRYKYNYDDECFIYAKDRCYTFMMHDFLTDNEIEEFNKDMTEK